MARIPDSELERLKREVSVERLALARGVKLERRGADLHGLCPFHEDREPSLVITPSKNLWHCLGACQAGGSVIDWVMRAEGVSFRHAVELLRADLPSLAASSPSPPVKTSTVKKLPGLASADAGDHELLLRVVDYYHATLKESPEALAYLKSRGLEDAEMIERFRLGFANRTLGYRLPAKNRQEGAAIRGRLQDLGILRETGHEHLRGSLVIPIFGEDGRVVQMYGRKITAGLRQGTPPHLYLPGPQRGVWNVAALKASREIILCESLIDALTFWCAGLRHVTTAYGTNGLTGDHWEAFRRFGTERILIAFDRDEAGERAAASVAEKLTAAGIEAFHVHFPKGMDANEYACKVKPASKSLEVVVRNATWLGKGKAPAIATTPTLPSHREEEAAKEESSAADDTVPGDPEPPAGRPDEPEASELTDEPDDEPTVADPDGDAGAPAPLPSLVAAPPASPAGRPQAAPSRSSSRSSVTLERHGEELCVRLGDRRWRIRGLEKNLSFEVMKVNVLVSRESERAPGGAFHVDTLDLYAARHRAAFVKQAADELGVEEQVVKKDLGRVLLALESVQEEEIQRRLEPESKVVELSEAERAAALALLRAPDLLDRILSDFERCGIVGEETNKLVGYLAATSRKLEEPLAVVIQSSSAAGKSSVMEVVLAFMPEEERVAYSAMTGQSLFYMGEEDLKHKILAIAEEEGAERASYALKLLQSEGQLTIASTGKDPQTGRLVTHEYRVEGPVMIFLTTTAIEMDEELLNRCLVLTVDEGREQTRAIHALQRERQTLEGLLVTQDRRRILKVHQDAQRLLRPLLVANPFARELTFLDHQTRTRRDHMKYLTLIRAIALLHQYQREVKTARHGGREVRYIEVTKQDIAVANRLAHEVLGRTLDELPPQTRRVLAAVCEMVAERCQVQGIERSGFRFTRREVREHTGLGNTQLKVHLHRLEELEYLLVHAGGRGQSLVYELVYEGDVDAGAPLLAGLIDVERLGKHEYDPHRSGPEGQWSGPSRPQVGGVSGGGRGTETAENATADNDLRRSVRDEPGNARPGRTNAAPSYIPAASSSLSRS
jgi:DNA primase catalytic core